MKEKRSIEGKKHDLNFPRYGSGQEVYGYNKEFLVEQTANRIVPWFSEEL